MAKLHELIKEMEAVRAEYSANAEGMTQGEARKVSDKIKGMQQEVQAVLTEGADDCDDGHRPIGIFHKGTPNAFEIGDPIVRDKRSRGASLEEAVDLWNSNEYLPAREPETIEATHTDASGNVKSKQSAKIKK